MENPFGYGVRELEKTAYKIRVDLIKALGRAGSGHSGGPLGMTDLVTAVYFYGAGIDPADPQNPDRDRILFSAGHYSPLIYAALAHAGYFTLEHFLADYRQFDGRLDGHPNFKTPGIENCSGPLGQGTSQAAGMAQVAQTDDLGWRVWLFMSDGEQQEGQVQEALMWIGRQKLNNLIAILDANDMQIDGPVSKVLPEDWAVSNYRNYGWEVLTVNGNNMRAIVKTINKALRLSARPKGKPILIYARTLPGKGVSFMEGDFHWHGQPPRGEEVTKALEDLRKIGKRLGVEYK